MGHFSSQCSTQSLHICEIEEEEPEPTGECDDEEVYEVGVSLIDEYEGDVEEIESSDLLGVVRCILTQTKIKEDWRRTNIL